MSFKENLDEFFKSVKGLLTIAFVFCIILIGSVWATGTTTASNFTKIIDTKIDERFDAKMDSDYKPMLVAINDKLDKIEGKIDETNAYQYKEQVRQINKTIEAMQKDPGDVKESNVEVILERWSTLPEQYKTDDIKIKYQAINEWYVKKTGTAK